MNIVSQIKILEEIQFFQSSQIFIRKKRKTKLNDIWTLSSQMLRHLTPVAAEGADSQFPDIRHCGEVVHDHLVVSIDEESLKTSESVRSGGWVDGSEAKVKLFER